MTRSIPSLSPELLGHGIVPSHPIGNTGEHEWFCSSPVPLSGEFAMVGGRPLPALRDAIAAASTIGLASGYAALLAGAILAGGVLAITTLVVEPENRVEVRLNDSAQSAPPKTTTGGTADIELALAPPERGAVVGYQIEGSGAHAGGSLFDQHQAEIARLVTMHGNPTGRVELELTAEQGRLVAVDVMSSTNAPTPFVDALVKRVERWRPGKQHGTRYEVLVLR